MNAPGLWDTAREEARGRALATPDALGPGRGRGAVPERDSAWKASSPESLTGEGPKKGEVGGPVLKAAGGLRNIQGGKNGGHFCHVEDGWGLGGRAVSPPAGAGKLV